MKRRTWNVTAPLSSDDLGTLRAFATNAVAEPATPVERVKHARTTQSLVRRGLLQKSDDKSVILVTPEGLAALMDTIPIQHITLPSSRSGGSTRPSRAARPSSRTPRSSTCGVTWNV